MARLVSKTLNKTETEKVKVTDLSLEDAVDFKGKRVIITGKDHHQKITFN